MNPLLHNHDLERVDSGSTFHFCPICRAAVPAAVRQVRVVEKVLQIPLNRGKVISYERVCEICRSVFPHDEEAFPALEDDESFRDRKALEIDLQRGRLNTPERLELIVEVIECLEYERHLEAREGNDVKFTVVITLFAFCVSLGTLMMWQEFLSPRNAAQQSNWLPWVVITSLVEVLVLAWVAERWLGATKRIVKRKLGPRIGFSLNALNPSEAEIARALEISGGRIARALTTTWVSKLMKQYPELP